MAKVGLGIKALILSVGLAGIHWIAHATGQTVPIVTGLMLIVSGVAIFTIDMW